MRQNPLNLTHTAVFIPDRRPHISIIILSLNNINFNIIVENNRGSHIPGDSDILCEI